MKALLSSLQLYTTSTQKNLLEQSSQPKLPWLKLNSSNWVCFSPYKCVSHQEIILVSKIYSLGKLCASTISVIQKLDFKITLLYTMWAMSRIRNRNFFRRELGMFMHNDFLGVIENCSYPLRLGIEQIWQSLWRWTM